MGGGSVLQTGLEFNDCYKNSHYCGFIRMICRFIIIKAEPMTS